MSSGPSKVIVLDPDPRAGRQLQLGCEREGVPVVVPPLAAAAGTALGIADEPGLVLVGGRDAATALDLVRRARAWLTTKGADVPIVFTGRGAARRDLEAAGANEVVSSPAFLRDVVTLARVLRGVPHDQRDHLTGSLAETTGVLTLVRAFSALGRSAVLTLIRGLRRGEVRFYHGEVTSAQVGLIHGQAALHQLLLWTDARFDYAHEDIVRRQQIPLSSEELFADAEQFLEGVREHAGTLSPATILEQDIQRVHALGKQIPTEVHGVLRMFDGHRVLADILEDSPYRVFETLRVAQKAVDVGLLRAVSTQRPKATWRAVLAIEEWLVGSETRDAVVERTQGLDSGPVKAAPPARKSKRRGGKRRSKKMKAAIPVSDLKGGDIDWGALVPRVIGAEVGPLSGVVPAHEAHGEVELPTRDKPREGLEALMDTQKRHRIFPTDIGLEPSIVVDATVGVAEPVTAPIAPAKRKRAEVERGEDRVLEPATAKTTDRHAAPPPPAAPPPATNGSPVRAPTGASDLDPQVAGLVAVPTHVEPMKSDPVAAVTAVPADAGEPRAARAGSTDPKALVRELVAEAVPAPVHTTVFEKPADLTPPFEKPAPSTSTLVAEPITVAEAGATSVAVADVMTVTGSAETAVVTASPRVLISEQPAVAPVASTEPARVAASTIDATHALPKLDRTPEPSDQTALAAKLDDATPRETDDEPSDGIVRAIVATADTARVSRARMRPLAPEHDGPPIKETTGEIRQRAHRETKEPPVVEPSIMIAEPSILVADLAAAHDAVAAAVAKPAPAAAPPADAASPSRELEVSDVRRDAVAFSEAEEAFFRGAEKTAQAPKLETFDDLDEGYQPPKFWDRVFGRKKPK